MKIKKIAYNFTGQGRETQTLRVIQGDRCRLWATFFSGKLRFLSRYNTDRNGHTAVETFFLNSGSRSALKPYDRVLFRGREMEVISFPFPLNSNESSPRQWVHVKIRKPNDPTTMRDAHVADLALLSKEVDNAEING